ncbi:hypothetical protein BjapCC829_22030 [Bradyrhizobium barranii]|uniref:Uncharacterized protein n=1 Tax=Bradyrhizobium barranii TaxID=2992140 RepID=A0ABY3QZF5_9BRAD|nr:hypothetical protein [Bradyrhizobium japonicum]UFW91070.1 hypothetical protein BjapCC829_22030 [Bradyrhizobium japonicum]
MRSTSATKLTLDYAANESSGELPSATSMVEGGSAMDSSFQTSNLEFPSFRGEAYAAAARRAGRINASAISDQEHEALLLERQLLLDKKFAGNISRKDANRLEYVRWSLDRIEDAKHGWAADALEDSIAGYERLSEDMRSLARQIEGLQKHK